MSLETAISELNTNIVALIGVMSGASVTTAPAPSKPPKAPKPAPVAAPAATSPTPTAPVAQPAAAPTPAPAAPASAAAPAPTIEEARKLVIELGQKKGREAVMALLTKYGASKLPEVGPHLYGAVIADATAALAA